MPRDLEYMRFAFNHFVPICEEQSPLYAHLSAACATDDEILMMASESQAGQPVVNMLMASVHFLLLSGVHHPLRQFYPSVGGDNTTLEDAWSHFRDFCLAHYDDVMDLIRTRRVQTNVVGRCGCLLPALSMLDRDSSFPLHLIELGASAGLNLNFDRYRYDYGDGIQIGSPSPVEIHVTTTEPGPRFWLGMPRVHDRVGLDIAPKDVTDDDEMRWIESLIWPDELDRIERFRHAVAIARLHRPTILQGDGIDLLPSVIAQVDAQRALPCIFHSHAIYQMQEAWHDRFDRTLDDIGRQRDLAHISLEWLADDTGPMLHLTTWFDGTPRRRLLAECHHHGKWIRWVDAAAE